MVDENGEPLVVYHGSLGDISEFRTSYDGTLGQGIYFSTDPRIASKYATDYSSDTDGAVYPVYLSAQNLYDVDANGGKTPKSEYGLPNNQLVEKLQSEGYDGIKWGHEIVVFEPEQVKSATGNRGTFDPNDTNILNQSEQRDLFVAHNISAPGVLAANELGGLAAPSIAVARSGVSRFEGYGEISLLADPSLLESAKVRTFDSDIYSPRQPRPVYDLNAKKLHDLAGRLDSIPGGSTLRFPDPETLAGDPNTLVYSEGAKAIFLDEQGRLPKLKKAKVEPWVRKAAKWGKSRYELQNDERFEKLILDETKKHLDELREADPDVADRYESRMIEREEDGGESVTFHILSDRASKVERFIANDGLDTDQLGRDIAKRFRTKKTQADFEKWARDTFSSMVDGKKLFKGFSPSGNRRYSDYTLTNVVREMTRELQGGENFNYGAGSVRAAFANELRRVTDVQARREQIVSPEEFESVKDESRQKLTDALEALKPFYKFDADGFGYLGDASSAIAEGRRGQAEAFELNDESRAIIDDLTSYLRELPTEYFEAKAQRAVDFSEFDIAVVPKGTDRDALKVLRDAGMKVKYYDPNKDGDRARVIGEQEQILFQNKRDTNRGRILIDRANNNFNIELLENADLSTFLHETGHYFLEVMGAVATDPNASDRTRKMYEDALKWMGAESRDQIGVEQHELFARTFEAYLRDGKAPSAELRPFFQRFAAWLKQIYRSLTQLNANLTDEVRSVFDRMLATDEEIQQAQDDAGYLVSLADIEGMEWTDDERQRLGEMRADARSQAESDLMAEQMKDLNKAEQEWWKKEKAKVRQEMLDSLNEVPAYQARQMLTAGKRANGDPLPEGVEQVKLDKQALVDEFGAEFLKELPSPRNPDNKSPQYAYSVKGGSDPSMVAHTYGFSSARALVNALIESKPVNQYVDALTEAEMRSRHPDINLSGQAAEVAKASVYNDKQAQLMLLELRKLERKAGKQETPARVMRMKAEEMIAGMKVRDVRPDLYARKTSKHSREAFQLAAEGRFSEAVTAKQRELMHHYLYKEALKAREQSEKIYRYAKRIQKKGSQEKIGKAGADYLERINEILEQYEFRRVSNKEIVRRQSLAEWLDRKAADGDHVDVPEEVIARSQRVNWRDVPLSELEAAYDAMRNLEHVARNKNRMLADKQQRELDELVTPAIQQIEQMAKKKGKGFAQNQSKFEQFLDKAKGYGGIAFNMDTMLRELDGFEDIGPVYQAVKASIDQAARVDLPVMQESFSNQLNDMYQKHYTKQQRKDMSTKVFVDLPGRRVTREVALSVALNWGNEGNREALVNGVASGHDKLEMAEIRKILDSLTEADWQFVQDVWDMMDFTLWPMVRDAQKKRTGVAPEKVEAVPVQTKFGTMRGGYYPIKFDAEMGWRVNEQQAEEMANEVRMGSFAKAQTKRGFTKARVGSAGQPLKLDLGVLHGHLNSVAVDISLGDAVSDASKVINHKGFVNAMEQTGNTWVLKAMDVWLKDVAAQEVAGSDVLSRMARHVRVGFTASKLSWNLGTVLLQPTGLAQSLPDIGYKYMAKGLYSLSPSRWLGDDSAFSQIYAKSPYMRTRGASFNKDLQLTLNELRDRGKLSAFASMGMQGIVKVQELVDAVVWTGAYEKGKEQFNTDDEAVQYADSMVARTQASGTFSDRSAFERGTLSNQTRQSEFIRLWTVLGSYMFAKGNIAYEKTRKRSFKDPVEVLKWTHDMFMLFTFEAIFIGLMRGFWPGEDDEETVAGYLASNTAMSLLGTMPLVRDGASAIQGFQGGGALGGFWDEVGRASRQVAQGEIDMPLFKALNNVGGTIFKYPAGQSNRMMESMWKDMNGEDVGVMDYLMYRQKDD
ncbi:hypothetical protein [Alcanivorax jadensis]|uniref:ADP-ribosyltransferase-containing protein n=1 Tax=Alcanivorax jadensis TaxID=64988 RepID=UPI002353EACA|nr:hypothetical protein [Alcanivorax jadensis]